MIVEEAVAQGQTTSFNSMNIEHVVIRHHMVSLWVGPGAAASLPLVWSYKLIKLMLTTYDLFACAKFMKKTYMHEVKFCCNVSIEAQE